jgi:hypothetical protein
MAFLPLGSIGQNNLGAVPASLQPLVPSLQNLIANLQLEFRLTPIRINELKFPNRKVFAILHRAFRILSSLELQVSSLQKLIANKRLKSELGAKDSIHLQNF